LIIHIATLPQRRTALEVRLGKAKEK